MRENTVFMKKSWPVLSAPNFLVRVATTCAIFYIFAPTHHHSVFLLNKFSPHRIIATAALNFSAIISCSVSCLCLLSHVSILMSPFSCLMSQVSCLTSPVSHHLSHVTCLTSPVSRPLSHVLRFLSHVSCLMYPISCISRFLSHVSCLLSHEPSTVPTYAKLFQTKTNYIHQQNYTILLSVSFSLVSC